MSSLTARDLFYTSGTLDESRVTTQVDEALHGFDDGELFLEYRQNETLVFDDGHLKNASFNTSQGFGLRTVQGDVIGYAHATDLSHEAIARAAGTVRSIYTPGNVMKVDAPLKTNKALYPANSPIDDVSFEDKVSLLTKIDAYLRGKDARVKQVTASLASEWQVVDIVRTGGDRRSDVRPLVRLNVTVVAQDGARMERGSSGHGGRQILQTYISEADWQRCADNALAQAIVNLDAVAAPAGEMTVVLGPGWPGVLLHEAIGHGLEGDFNRKGTSAFSGLIGQRVAAPGVTVVDNGTMDGRRGSISLDDEGTPSSCTTLIEDGILVGFMQDRMNARLMGVPATGNGRRESFESPILPRMTNTYMLAGAQTPEEIIAGVPNGLYARQFGGGQVDITSGKFVFSATEAYLIEDGKITRPVKGATIVGNGPECLTRVTGVGNDLELDEGIGTCGKDGQSVPVGVGQPTLRIDGLTVGGTAA